jgi:hypothetical protein
MRSSSFHVDSSSFEPINARTALMSSSPGKVLMRLLPRLCCVLPVLILSLALPAMAAEGPTAPASTDEQQLDARQLANILCAAEKVIADNQDLIDDPGKGDKGLSADVVLAKAAENYLAATKEPWPSTEGDTRRAKLTRTLVGIIRAVMDKAQPLINESGKGYKSFIPPIFTDQVAREFCRSMEGVAVIRITAPPELLRNRRHRPDEWEIKVFDSQLKTASWEKGKPVIERGEYKGKGGVRLLTPQYYDQSCLKCHGEPKGERDINGGTKEGGKLGDLGGAISVVIFDEK